MGKVIVGKGIATLAVAACMVAAPLAGIASAQGTSGSGNDEPLATLKVDSPNVEVKKADGDEFKKAKDGQKLREGDTVRTDATGRAEIDYGDDAYTRLDVNTTFTVVSLTDDQGNRQVDGSLEQGRTWNRTVSLTESESFEQSGGGATAAVTGTAFAVECESIEHCDFTAIVDITTLTGADGVQKLLTPLDQCDSTSGVLCGDITKISADDLPQWITENLLRDLIERGLDDGGLQGTLVIEDDGTVNFVPSPPAGSGNSTTSPPPPDDDTQPPDTSTAPDAPTGVSALPGWQSATVSWTPGSNGGAAVTTYTVTATPVGTSVASVQTCPVAPPATSCTVTGLDNGSLYTFTVTATNAKGTSPVSTPSNPVIPSVVVPLGSECGGEDQLPCPVFKYTSTNPGTGFDEPEFDDSGWQDGSAPFATGTPGVCPAQDFPAGTSPFPVSGDVWVRLTFELPAGASNLQVVGTVDNIAQVFVNGEQIGSTSTGYCVTDTIDFLIPDELLAEGVNVVAVHASDTGAQSFLDFTVEYAEPPSSTEVSSDEPGQSTTTSSTTTTSTTTTAPPAVVEETTSTTSAAPAE